MITILHVLYELYFTFSLHQTKLASQLFEFKVSVKIFRIIFVHRPVIDFKCFKKEILTVERVEKVYNNLKQAILCVWTWIFLCFLKRLGWVKTISGTGSVKFKSWNASSRSCMDKEDLNIRSLYFIAYNSASSVFNLMLVSPLEALKASKYQLI